MHGHLFAESVYHLNSRNKSFSHIYSGSSLHWEAICVTKVTRNKIKDGFISKDPVFGGFTVEFSFKACVSHTLLKSHIYTVLMNICLDFYPDLMT